MKYTKLGKEHAYLGHFRGCLKAGHNTNEMPVETEAAKKTLKDAVLKDVVKGDLPKKDTATVPTKPPLPGGVRG